MSETTSSAEVSATPRPWDPFQLMDRMDEEALRKELEGVASTDLVYVVKEGGQEIVGLSKTGVDECCMALVSQGQVIREEELAYDIVGEGEDREALAALLRAAGPRPRCTGTESEVQGQDLPGAARDSRRPRLPQLDGRELRRGRDPRFRSSDSRRRRDCRPAREAAQPPLVRSRSDEGR